MGACFRRISLLALLSTAVVSNSQCNRPATDALAHAQNGSESNTEAVPVSEPALQGRAAGEVRPFSLAGDDIKASLLAHPAPEVWLVFEPSMGGGQSQGARANRGDVTLKVELPPEGNRRCHLTGQRRLPFTSPRTTA